RHRTGWRHHGCQRALLTIGESLGAIQVDCTLGRVKRRNFQHITELLREKFRTCHRRAIG
ncbi:hypothetical protein QP277_26230, partial [Escherichia coli]|nr:hypothetical protein [Escherichia coli]